ncbi:M56 family metallopeptidase [Chondromyces apiculatus]|uniref:Peptidase M56 domain-containing protein n=1 Tax=Chondromyces apiculatus DSM 436 TaxID=1192034 RepID=A0A017T9M9_9BACT|nr:M56 family metallopeptidase [Chondromyces apiculatus]EYF05515.1 Hypothetical protein CAP_3243 [Chondromyces apiculatus DSM 436]
MNTMLGFLFTYWIHSTILLSLAWALDRVLDRVLRARPEVRELAWRVALLGGLVTASAQMLASIQPLGGSWDVAGPAPEAAAHAPHAPRTAVAEVSALPPRAPAVTVRVPGARIAIAPRHDATVLSPGGTDLSPVALRGPAAAPIPAAVSAWSWREVALGVWVLGAALLTFGLWRSWRTLSRRLAGRRPVTDPSMLETLLVLAARSPRVHEPELSVTGRVTVPMAFGIRRPEICVPARAISDLSQEAQEGMLAHELGHLVRRDPLWRLVVGLIQRIFFFQPLNGLAARRLADCAELLADDWAARRTSEPLSLAECLTQVARWTTTEDMGLPVATMSAGASGLGQRVQRLVRGDGLATERRHPLWTGSLVGTVLVALALLAPSACGGRAAQGAPPSSPDGRRDAAQDLEDAEEARREAEEARREEEEARREAEREARTWAREVRRETKEAVREAKIRAREARRMAQLHRDDSDSDNDSDNDDDNDRGPRRDRRTHTHRIQVNAPPVDIDIDIDEKEILSALAGVVPPEAMRHLQREIHTSLQADLDDVADDVHEGLERARHEIEKALEEARAAEEEHRRHPDAARAPGMDDASRKALEKALADVARAHETAEKAHQAADEARQKALDAAEKSLEAAEKARDKARDDAAKLRDKAREAAEKQRQKALADAEKTRQKLLGDAAKVREEARRAAEKARQKAREDAAKRP